MQTAAIDSTVIMGILNITLRCCAYVIVKSLFWVQSVRSGISTERMLTAGRTLKTSLNASAAHFQKRWANRPRPGAATVIIIVIDTIIQRIRR